MKQQIFGLINLAFCSANEFSYELFWGLLGTGDDRGKPRVKIKLNDFSFFSGHVHRDTNAV